DHFRDKSTCGDVHLQRPTAISSSTTGPPPTAKTTCCLPLAMYVIGEPDALAGSGISASNSPVDLLYTHRCGSRLARSLVHRFASATYRGAPTEPICTTIITVLVISAQLRESQPNRSRMSRWLIAGCFTGPRPIGMRHRCSPVFISMATTLANGGLNSGSPRGPGR